MLDSLPGGYLLGKILTKSNPDWRDKWGRSRQDILNGEKVAPWDLHMEMDPASDADTNTSTDESANAEEIGDAPADAAAIDDEGCIYCVSGANTQSGKDYIGSTDDMKQREKDKSDGRNRVGAEKIDSYKKGDNFSRRMKEQKAINDRGGVDNLDNKRNEIAPGNWKNFGL